MPSPAPDAPRSPADPTGLAARLLDAQVAWVVDGLTGEAFAETVAADVARVLEVARRLRLRARSLRR